MTILYPMVHYPPVIGGIEQWAENIAIRQGEDKEIIIVTGKVKGAPNEERKNNIKIFRTSLFSLSNLSHSSPVYMLSALPFILCKSARVCFKEKISLIHCHGFLSALSGYFILGIFGIPFLITEQSTGWAKGKMKILRSFVYKRAKTCVASSRAVADEFRALGIKSVVIIPNGVDLSLFSDAAGARNESSIIKILSVGRLEKVKGHEFLIDAFVEIKREIPNAKLVIIGSGSLAKDLILKVQGLNLEGSVDFIGEVAHSDLPKYYANADIFVMPSLEEGFGIAVIEAMASGVPVIATKVGGLLDLIEDGKNGILVESRNANVIKEAVLELSRNQERAKFLSENAKKNIENFSWDKIAKKVSQLYGEIVPDASVLKVTILASILPPDIGGPAIYAQKLANEFAGMGARVDIMLARKLDFIFKIFGKARGADILYSLSSSPKVLIPAFVSTKLLRRKLVIRIGGDYLWERAVEKRGVSITVREFYTTYSKSFREKIEFLVLKYILRNSDAVIFTTTFQQELYAKHFNLNNARSKVIENPFPRVNRNTEMSFPSEPLIIFYGGRIIKLKNLDMLISAFKEVRVSSKKKIILKITGNGPLAEDLRLKIKDLRLDDSVTITDRITHEGLLKEFYSAWLAILPSLSEISPNFVLEAVSCGIPVLCTKDVGLSRKITDNLLTFDPRSRDELVSLILKMLEPAEWLKYKRGILEIDTERSFRDVAVEHLGIFRGLDR